MPRRPARARALPLFVFLLIASIAAADSGEEAQAIADRDDRELDAPGDAPVGACDPGCVARGNCNIEEGRCECQFGFTGPTCEEPQLPACQASKDDMPFWGVFQPKNCECYKQATKFFNCTPGNSQTCQNVIYQLRLATARCYTFTGKDVSEQWSAMPEKGAPGVEWFQFDAAFGLKSIDEARGRKCINLWGHDKCVGLPLSACPGGCSGHGVCIDSCFPEEARAPWCECHKGYSGASCEQVQPELCPNACNDRGTCVRGFCHCRPPNFGLDCSRSKAVPARPGALPTRARPVVYVYELPHSVSSPVELDDNLADNHPIYTSYTHFLHLFLKDWAVRTEDPWEANLFYIPSFTYSYTSNMGDATPHVLRVVEYVRSTFPFYNRTHGRDHFMWFTSDHGTCGMPADVANLIKVVHFAYHADERIQGPSVMGRTPRDPVHGCFNPARDVTAAPYNDVGHQDADAVYAQIVRDSGAAPHRRNLFFFAGGVRGGPGHEKYSGGVRQAIASMLKETLGEGATSGQHDDIVFIEGFTDKYRELYNTTKFCLAPHGAGFGIRLSIAMVHGCIPVIIQDHVYQPYESVIPYDEISVRIAKRDIPDLLPILRAVTEEEQAAMRLKMAEHYRAFIWEPHHGGRAYEYTITALFKRLHQLWGELYL